MKKALLPLKLVVIVLFAGVNLARRCARPASRVLHTSHIDDVMRSSNRARTTSHLDNYQYINHGKTAIELINSVEEEKPDAMPVIIDQPIVIRKN